MRINSHQLSAHLRDKGLAPLYLVTGDEPLLAQEACDTIREKARAEGYEERQVFHPESQADWQQIGEETGALSLFASRRRLEVRLPAGKAGEGAEVIQGFLAQPPEDVLLLITGPRLEGNENRKAWLKAVMERGVHVPVWPVDGAEFPRWLQERAERLGLRLTEGALEVLQARLEGNLLAASQELQRLQLLAGEQTLDETVVERIVQDSARFNPFELTGEVLRGRGAHACRILSRLEQEGVHPLALIGVIHQDLKRLQQLLHASHQGTDPLQHLRTTGVRQRDHQQALITASRHLSSGRIQALVRLCARADQAAKGASDSNPWGWLRELVVEASSR